MKEKKYFGNRIYPTKTVDGYASRSALLSSASLGSSLLALSVLCFAMLAGACQVGDGALGGAQTPYAFSNPNGVGSVMQAGGQGCEIYLTPPLPEEPVCADGDCSVRTFPTFNSFSSSRNCARVYSLVESQEEGAPHVGHFAPRSTPGDGGEVHGLWAAPEAAKVKKIEIENISNVVLRDRDRDHYCHAVTDSEEQDQDCRDFAGPSRSAVYRIYWQDDNGNSHEADLEPRDQNQNTTINTYGFDEGASRVRVILSTDDNSAAPEVAAENYMLFAPVKFIYVDPDTDEEPPAEEPPSEEPPQEEPPKEEHPSEKPPQEGLPREGPPQQTPGETLRCDPNREYVPVCYTVWVGDTLHAIGRNRGVPESCRYTSSEWIDDVMQNNVWCSPDLLHVGQRLQLLCPKDNPNCWSLYQATKDDPCEKSAGTFNSVGATDAWCISTCNAWWFQGSCY